MNSRNDYLTNGQDLESIASSCTTCFKYLQHGKNIISYTQLPHLFIAPHRRKVSAYCVNTKLSHHLSGHWITLILFDRQVLLCDGLNYVQKRLDVMENIQTFCNKNKCKLIVMQLRSQENDSSKCGFLALAFIAKFHSLSKKKFYNLQKVFKRHSIKNNEKFLLKFAEKHFHFQI